eukprot:gene14284-1171_t
MTVLRDEPHAVMRMLTASGRADGQAPGDDDIITSDDDYLNHLAQANRGPTAAGHHRAHRRSGSRAANKFPNPAPAPTHIGAVPAMAPTRAPTLVPISLSPAGRPTA